MCQVSATPVIKACVSTIYNVGKLLTLEADGDYIALSADRQRVIYNKDNSSVLEDYLEKNLLILQDTMSNQNYIYDADLDPRDSDAAAVEAFLKKPTDVSQELICKITTSNTSSLA